MLVRIQLLQQCDGVGVREAVAQRDLPFAPQFVGVEVDGGARRNQQAQRAWVRQGTAYEEIQVRVTYAPAFVEQVLDVVEERDNQVAGHQLEEAIDALFRRQVAVTEYPVRLLGCVGRQHARDV